MTHIGWCLILALLSFVHATEMVNVPLGDPIYDFIDRMTVKGVIPEVVTEILPLTQGEVAQLLKNISEKVNRGEAKLTGAEKARLDDLLVLFVDELETLDCKVDGKPHFLQAKGDGYNFSFDADFSQELTFLRSEPKASASSLRLVVMGGIRDDFAFATDIQTRLLIGETEYYPYTTENTLHFSEKVERTSLINAYIKFKLPWFELQLGKDNLWWGPGRWGALLISDNSPSWDMLKLETSYGRFRFNAFTAILRSELGEKYLSGHRLEVLVFPKLRIGIHEVVVYANRFELHYLNPVTIYFLATPALESIGFNDNMLIGGDFVLLPIKNIKLYGELMVDNFQPQDLPSIHSEGDTFGILFGAYYADAFGLEDTDLRVEYAFLNQFAYTHSIPINSYQHHGYVIGHWLGPDADDFRCDITHYLFNRVSLRLTYELERHGEGSIDKPCPPGVHEWEFLSGIAEKKHSLGFEFKYQAVGRYSFSMNYKFTTIRNKDNSPGAVSNSHTIGLEIGYRFK